MFHEGFMVELLLGGWLQVLCCQNQFIDLALAGGGVQAIAILEDAVEKLLFALLIGHSHERGVQTLVVAQDVLQQLLGRQRAEWACDSAFTTED